MRALLLLLAVSACDRPRPAEVPPEASKVGTPLGPPAEASVFDAAPPVGVADDDRDARRRREDAEREAWMEAYRKMTPAQRAASRDLVFVGKVVALGKEPSEWSGGYAGAEQQLVELEVVTSLKGAPPKRISVSIAVLSGDPLARKDRPGLSPDVLAKGTKLIIGAAHRGHDDYAASSDNVLRWSAALENETRRAVPDSG